jgi:hypothetical protein
MDNLKKKLFFFWSVQKMHQVPRPEFGPYNLEIAVK